MFADFTAELVHLEDVEIFVRQGGAGEPLLLLHGFPETADMWHAIAPILASQFRVVCADLRGYGRSSCPSSSGDHVAYSKRVMAHDMVRCMRSLGHESFLLAGHDRGARVAYRMALDHPSVVRKLAVLDVIPTDTSWDLANADFALAFWPWVLLAQEEPFPEEVLARSADAVVRTALTGWGSPQSVFPDTLQRAYAQMLSEPAHAHAICEEYRAAATVDREHDRADLAAGRRIGCDTLVLWSAKGPLGTWYEEHGGPLQLWKPLAELATGEGVDGGHFFPEEFPDATAQRLRRFFAG